MTWSFQGKGAEKCRRKRRLWKMASICSAHHYSAEQSQLLRWIQGRTARWSWQSRYLCRGRIWEDLQEKWTGTWKGFLMLSGCLHSWLGWKGKKERGLVTGRGDDCCLHKCWNQSRFLWKWEIIWEWPGSHIIYKKINKIKKKYVDVAVFPNILHIISQWGNSVSCMQPRH